MTYYESAEGETISKARSIRELRRHGMEDMTEFYAELGDHETYDAQAVLLWLGY